MSSLTRVLAQRRNPIIRNLAARTSALSAAALSALLVARLGGPAAVGVFALLRVLPPTVSVIFSGGMPGAVPYFMAGPARSNPYLRLTLLSIAAVTGTVGAGLWIISAPWLERFLFASVPTILVAWAGLRVFTYMFLTTARACSLGSDDLKGSNRVFVLEEFMFLPLYALLQVVGIHGSAAVIIALLLSDVGTGLYGWARLARRGFFSGVGRPSLALARRVIGFGIRGEVGNLLLLLNLRLDVILVGALVGPATLGTYAIASRFAELLRLPPVAMTYVLQPQLAAADPASAARRARALFPKAFALTASLVLPLGLVAFLIPVVFGEPFRASILPAQILLVGLATEGIGGVCIAFLYGIGRPGLNSMAMALGLAVTVGLDVLLIPRFGAVGAAVASAVTYLVTTGLLLVCFWAVTHGPGQFMQRSTALRDGRTGAVTNLLSDASSATAVDAPTQAIVIARSGTGPGPPVRFDGDRTRR